MNLGFCSPPETKASQGRTASNNAASLLMLSRQISKSTGEKRTFILCAFRASRRR